MPPTISANPSRNGYAKEKAHGLIPPPRIWIFSSCEEAESARSRLVEQGLPRERLHLLRTDSVPPALAPQAGSNEVLKDMLVDGAIGTAVGTGIGAPAELALVEANVILFVASPLIAPLANLG
jgi:hypothetical protein